MRPQRSDLDLRLIPSALGVWLGAALCLGAAPVVAITVGLALWAFMLVGWRMHARPAILLALVVAGAGLCATGLRVAAVHAGPLSALAEAGVSVRVTGRITSDPVVKPGAFGDSVIVRMSVSRLVHSGSVTTGSTPVLVIADESWRRIAYGAVVEAFGRLETARTPDIAAVLLSELPPDVVAAPNPALRIVGRVREGLTRAARPLPPAERALLPALVDGDTSGLSQQMQDEFRAAGLTHLLAVSGSNLSLVLAFVLFVARWCRVTGTFRVALGVVTVAMFVLLARPEPSVLRAAAMGLVTLLAMTRTSRAVGVRSLAVAVCALVLMDPWLARSWGFVLSTLATVGIVVLAPRWREALARWLPRWLAEAVAVPLAAQVVCTPAIALLSGQVSLVAVFANLLAAPAVGPATVLSLIAGVVAVAWAGLGQLLARAAGVPLWWIVEIAHRAAGLAGADVVWGTGVVDIAVLLGGCVIAILLLPRMLARRTPSLLAAGLLLSVLVHPIPRPGWPPSGWVFVACDVGQGDGLVLNAGGGSAVVVDTGPEPAPMVSCLRDLGVRRIPVLVLTHFHADHVGGVSGVLGGWPVGRILVSPVRAPVDGVASVQSAADAHGVRTSTVGIGDVWTVGRLHMRVLGPPPSAVAAADAELGAGDDGSGPNNASVVLLVRTAGIRILLTGDAEPEEQDALLTGGADLHADVLKEPHHGSGHLDPAFIAATHARVSVISVGSGNDYGQPAPSTLALLARLHMRVLRTDLDGAVAVVVRDGAISTVTTH